VSETSLREWWNNGVSEHVLNTYSFLTEKDIAFRLDELEPVKWRLTIDDMLGRIALIPIDSYFEREKYFRSIDAQLSVFETLEDAIPLLELALWKAKLVEQSYPSDEESTIASKLQHRVTCGADVIIPNVLSFLIR